MKRFTFSLDRVRLWRREQASLEELKLGQLFGELAEIQRKRTELEGSSAAAGAAILQRKVIAHDDLSGLDAFRDFIRAEVLRNEARRKECQKRIDAQRKVVIEAKRKFELLERLREKQLAEWEAAQDKEQEELAAELYLAKMRRESRAGGS